jgi:carbon storage regulator
MLVITRKIDEIIVIETSGGEKIEITVLETMKDKVKLGVNAPKEVKIVRSELLMVKTFNVEASKAVSKTAFDALMNINKKI